jgi:hypothetical protein
MTNLVELQDLMKMYRGAVGYVSGDIGEVVEPVFLSAVIRSVSDYVEKVESSTADELKEKAYKVAVSLLMCALDISNLFEIDLSERVMETFLEKFSTKET